MSAGQFKRTGAFIGTVATGIAVAKMVRPSRGPAVIDAAGNVFRNSLYAAIGGETEGARLDAERTPTRTRTASPYERDQKIRPGDYRYVPVQKHEEAASLFPLFDVSTVPDPFRIPSFKYWLWSLVPHVLPPFKRETWEQAACRIWDVQPMTWEDANTVADLVHVLKTECGTDGE